MDENYEKLLKVVESIEAAAKPEEVNFVDTTNIEDQQLSARRPQYSEMLKLIYGIESRNVAETKQQGAQMRQQERAQQDAQVQQERAVAQRRPISVQFPRAPELNIGSTISKGARGGLGKMEEEKAAVGREFGALAKDIGALEPRVKLMTVKKINTRSLVLPNLSVSDQLVELERIAQGLKEGVFDQDQLSVIRQEVMGLAQTVRQAAQSHDSISTARDQRLSEVLSMMNG
ncbi:MAG: hypothetical protein KGH66_03705 [Candidatus Micrarchaeota archaeon]|nr:hypothetical protein [Candidatus Micrarchaeota archaeon]